MAAMALGKPIVAMERITVCRISDAVAPASKARRVCEWTAPSSRAPIAMPSGSTLLAFGRADQPPQPPRRAAPRLWPPLENLPQTCGSASAPALGRFASHAKMAALSRATVPSRLQRLRPS
jgi:hypothetical protein